MADDVALFHGRNDAIEQVQVRSADGAGRHLDDGVARVFDLRIHHRVVADVALTVPAERLHDTFLLSPEPGSVMPRCISARTADGVTNAIAERSLFIQPVTTSPSPFIMASKPVFATSAGSSFFDCATLVSMRSARSKKSVSVAPGIRQVTVTPVSLSSLRSAKEKRSRKALLAL